MAEQAAEHCSARLQGMRAGVGAAAAAACPGASESTSHGAVAEPAGQHMACGLLSQRQAKRAGYLAAATRCAACQLLL